MKNYPILENASELDIETLLQLEHFMIKSIEHYFDSLNPTFLVEDRNETTDVLPATKCIKPY